MNLNQVITVSPKVISQEVAGETVIARWPAPPLTLVGGAS